jgi:hypothetical protein
MGCKYSKPSLIRISEAKGSPKKLGTQVNGKCNDVSSADENKQQKYHHISFI